jgi:hypothetical protein
MINTHRVRSGEEYNLYKHYQKIYLFTSNIDKEKDSKYFWPLNLFTYEYENQEENETVFPGFFYQYDISEFIAYIFLILLLYFISFKRDDDDFWVEFSQVFIFILVFIYLGGRFFYHIIKG